eukprot:scaffold182167_cov21-Tisochrysis_lutea.AAC.1
MKNTRMSCPAMAHLLSRTTCARSSLTSCSATSSCATGLVSAGGLPCGRASTSAGSKRVG